MTQKRLFGTDGIRGRANQGELAPSTVVSIAQAAGSVLRKGMAGHGLVVIGKDTRLSGYTIESALVAGFTSIGMDVALTGPIPAPAVAMMTCSLRADLGIMISASHNPFEDNGIKLFGPDGRKLDDAAEQAIADLVAAPDRIVCSDPGDVGRARRIDDAVGRYCEFAKATFPRGLSLKGLRIVVDPGHGAAYRVAPDVLFELGAEVVTIGAAPNGTNINAGCGVMHPRKLAQTTLQENADLGLALDGDADRVLLVDELGSVIDGDQILGCIATHWHRAGRLRGGGIAATVLSNLGLERLCRDQGLALHRTAVGDRHVAECLWRHGLNLGGEQSGHVICSDFTTTGDGLIAGLQAMVAMLDMDQPASLALRSFEPVPQRMVNVPCIDPGVVERASVRAAVDRVTGRLAGSGRVILRPSGTEPVLRVMAEVENPALLDQAVSEVVDAVGRELAA